MTIEPKDIIINSFQPAIPGAKYSIRITHTPSGVFTSSHSDVSYFRAKKLAEEELIELLEEIQWDKS